VDGGSRNLEISQHDGFILVGVSFVFSKVEGTIHGH
jgi:hypothetical protein